MLVYVATDRFSWVVIGLALFAAGSVAAYYVFDHVQTRCRPGWTRSRILTAPATRWCSRCSASPPAGFSAPGSATVSPARCAASTDFIIAAVGEELGLVGLAGVLMLYTIVIIRGLRTAIAVRDSFGKLLAAGLASTLAIQLFIVVGGVTKLIPLTGLTTPWMSYGGSSLLANLRAAGDPGPHLAAARRPIVDPAAQQLADRVGRAPR